MIWWQVEGSIWEWPVFRRTGTDVKFTPVMTDHFGVLCLRDHPFGKTNKRLEWSMLRDMPIIGNITHRFFDQHLSIAIYETAHLHVDADVSSGEC